MFPLRSWILAVVLVRAMCGFAQKKTAPSALFVVRFVNLVLFQGLVSRRVSDRFFAVDLDDDS